MAPDRHTVHAGDPTLGFQLALAFIALRRMFQRSIGTPFSLRPVEFSLLVLLIEYPGASPKTLGGALRVSPPNMTVLIDRLQARGLVERRRSTADGRVQHVLLTAAGAALAHQAREVSLSMEEPALEMLSAEERGVLRALLAKVAHWNGRSV